MRTYSYDAKMLLSDGAAPYAASGIGQVAGANAILNLGGMGDVRTDLGLVGDLTRSDYACILNASALTVGAGANYAIWIMGSNLATGANPVVLGGTMLGLGSTLPNGAGTALLTDVLGTGSTTSAPFRQELYFSTEKNGVCYQWVYLYNVVTGSITLTAYLAKLPIE